MLRGNQFKQREDQLFSNGVNSAGVFYAEGRAIREQQQKKELMATK